MNENELRPKSSGRALHVSGFACDCHGFMKATINDTVKNPSKLSRPGRIMMDTGAVLILFPK